MIHSLKTHLCVLLQALGLGSITVGTLWLYEGNTFGETLAGDGYKTGSGLLITGGIITCIVSAIAVLGAIFTRRLVLGIVSVSLKVCLYTSSLHCG